MLHLIGPDQTLEYRAAQDLAARATVECPDLPTSPHHQLTLVAAAKCYGQPVSDIDVLLLFQTTRPLPLPPVAGDDRAVTLVNCCLAIEIKDHPANRLRLVGTQVEVRYRDRWHNVSEQSHRQIYAVKGYLEARSVRPPFVINLIWLRQVSERDLPLPPHNLIGQEATWKTVLERVRQIARPYWHHSSASWRIQSATDLTQVCEAFTRVRTPQPTSREQEKIQGVIRAANKMQVPAYVDKLGTQLLILKGRGGTGKTATLLKLALMLYEHRQARVLILTYNRALVADLRRLLALMDIRDHIAQQSIAVQTVHSFFFQLLRGFRVIAYPCHDFLKRYEEYKAMLTMMLPSEREHVPDLIQERNAAFTWDFLFIDEAQDWPTDERDLLFRVYDHRHVVLADGGDQLIRGYRACNWIAPILPADRQIVTFSKSLRLKAGVCTFVNAFAEQVGLTDWQVEPFGDAPGRVIVQYGPYADQRTLHDEIVQQHQAQGRDLIDLLFCVPPRLVKREPDGTTGSLVAHVLHSWGFATWDATNPVITGQYPIDPQQIRIVQYDSCRGLEGWTVVHLGFDELYRYKVNAFDPGEPAQQVLFDDPAQAAHDYAMRWLMIPLTRGVHTLVLQLSPGAGHDHPVVAALRAVAQRWPHLVEWRGRR